MFIFNELWIKKEVIRRMGYTRIETEAGGAVR